MPLTINEIQSIHVALRTIPGLGHFEIDRFLRLLASVAPPLDGTPACAATWAELIERTAVGIENEITFMIEKLVALRSVNAAVRARGGWGAVANTVAVVASGKDA